MFAPLRFQQVLVANFAMTVLLGAASAQESTPAAATAAKPRIVILATGGTIAGAAATGTQSGYTSGAVTIDSMLAAVPGVDKLASVKGEQISNVGSQDMSFDILLKVAKRINELAAKPDVDGIVVTHGTDTMEESAFFLNLTVKTDKPVVLVGSMRPSTALSADGPLNLYNAIAVAADPKARGRGVLVVMNDQIHAAHSLNKTNATTVETFQSTMGGPVGITAYGKNTYFYSPPWKHTSQSDFDIANVSKVPRVDVIYACTDMSPDLIDASVANGAKGIVIAGMGNGNMNKASADAAARAVQKGVVVVRSSRVQAGVIGRNVELDDDKLGFVASNQLDPEKSRVLLTLALLKQRPPAEIQKLYYTY